VTPSLTENLKIAGTMNKQPELKTERLILRPFRPDDAPIVQKLAGDKAIADTTLNIPHPYEDGVAESWIAAHADNFEQGKIVTFAITVREEKLLVGSIALAINKRFERAEMGYWIGKPYWNKGYCTEAAKALLKYGFEELKLNRIFAHYLVRNQSSGRVMEKMGMKYEGTFRGHIKRWNDYEDLNLYAILRKEFIKDS